MFRDTDALFVACKQNGLDVNAEKTKNIVMTPDHPAGQNHSRNMMEQFKDLETTLSNQNFIYEEIQSRFNSRKFLPSSLLPKNMMIVTIYRIKFCLLFCMGVKLGH